jgi:hypothetical protein
MKKIFLALVLSLLLLLVASTALAGGIRNTSHVRFYQGGGPWIDSYWLETKSGLLHEWRTTDMKHFVFKPLWKFPEADCDPDAYNSFLWTAHTYPQSDDDDADLEDFLEMGSQYWVCMYHWDD